MASRRDLIALLTVVIAVTLWSWVNPYDRLTWWMESAPVLIAVPLLLATRHNFPLTRLAYYLIAFHAVILLVGAHYTYARVPPGNWIQDLFDLSRNHYDRFAHVIQGAVPAILAREILIRFNVVNYSRWLFFLVCCFCLAFSALYEIIEWQSSVLGGDSSLDFLGVQGDIWDAQWDMTLALMGAIVAQLVLSALHKKQLDQLGVGG